MMRQNRELPWPGCTNVRDLGGLATLDGGRTKWGALIRGDHPSKLTQAGREEALAHGVRTVIELYTENQKDKERPERSERPTSLQTHRIAIEDLADAEFHKHWIETGLWCTPRYYSDALQRWPERHANIIAAFADAPPGGVFVHCVRGFDRTGIATLLLLALARVEPEAIVADYLLSLSSASRDDQDRFHSMMRGHGSAEDVIRRTLDGLDAHQYLRDAGLTEETVARAKARLV